MKKTFFFSVAITLVLVCVHSTSHCICSLPDAFDRDAVYAQVIYVDPEGSDETGQGSKESPYRTLAKAVAQAKPGTDIVLGTGKYPTGNYFSTLKGTAEAPIRIRGESSQNPAVFSGGSTGIQISDPRYLVLENLLIEETSSNGLNIDDGGTYDSPADYVILRHLTVQNIESSGNVDGIKLSGLDHFLIEHCTIINPGDGGSAIDMVGCHEGILTQNIIRDCQSSGIQAKGGCARVLIYANRFENAGMRPINMGGSTGMQYFRPLDAAYEAAHITAWANLFIGGDVSVAFVGCEYGLFAQNTIYLPQKWVCRILQENNNAQLIQNRNNVFANNIVVIDDHVSTFVNVGPNTHSETYLFANNLWYHTRNDRFSGPNLPVSETNGIIQKDPRFVNAELGDFQLQSDSPAIGVGGDLRKILGAVEIDIPEIGDFLQQCWSEPPSVGAWEGNPFTGIRNWKHQK